MKSRSEILFDLLDTPSYLLIQLQYSKQTLILCSKIMTMKLEDQRTDEIAKSQTGHVIWDFIG